MTRSQEIILMLGAIGITAGLSFVAGASTRHKDYEIRVGDILTQKITGQEGVLLKINSDGSYKMAWGNREHLYEGDCASLTWSK